MKKLVISIAALLCTGCSTSLQSGWQDFRAYYNTYYNAADRFHRGVEELGNPPFSVEEEEWIRIYPSRHIEGQPDFQAAIDKSATILQKFPQSKWADDALFLMARSHYHRNELFKSLQYFEELYRRSGDITLQNEAVLWKSRVLYDLERHEDAVAYLQEHLDGMEVRPERNYRAEAKALLAEHYSRIDQLEQARELLGQAASELPVGDIRSRTHFMYGQVLERMGAHREAYYAYSNVAQGYPAWEYIFWSEIHKARMARMTDRTEEAIGILESLRRDDKSYGYADLINLEIGRTLESAGRIAEAEQVYGDLLHHSREAPGEDIRSRAYYRLGIIYSEKHRNYSVAAAYYDSASAGSRTPSAWSGGQGETRNLASAYRRYGEIRKRISHTDSLLWLGTLSGPELDSVISVERERRLNELKREQDRRTEVLYNAASDAQGNRSSALFGFLNHRNEGMAEVSASRFRAYWGDRPPIDDWRRTEAVRNHSASGGPGMTADREADSPEPEAVQLDLEEIPVTEAEREELYHTLAESYFELGNLFLLTLQMPDSARGYYRRVHRQYPEAEVTPRALWSLHELYRNGGEADSAEMIRRRLLAYDREELDISLQRLLYPGDSLAGGRPLREAAAGILQDTSAVPGEQTARLKELAAENRSDPEAPAIWYLALERQIHAARKGDDPGRQGAEWDSVRSALQRFRALFPDAPQAEKAALLQEELESGYASGPGPGSAAVSMTCEEADARLAVRGGTKAFMDSISLPESVAEMQLEGEITYRFGIDETGSVRSWELISPDTGLGIERALEEAFPDLKFHPVRTGGEPVAVECPFSFPIDLSDR